MGHYISVTLRFETCASGLQVFAPLFAVEHFSPVAIAGIGSSATARNRWLLAGHGLEAFVTQFAWPERGNSSSFTLIPSPLLDQGRYLEQLVAQIKTHKCPTRQLSLYEYAVQEVGATFIDAPALDLSVITECSDWLMDCQTSYVELFGTFSVATLSPEKCDWKRAFRFVVDEPTDYIPLGIPFVHFKYNPQIRELGCFSESTICARELSSLNGFVSGEVADQNLRHLGHIMKALCTGPFKGLTKEVLVEGSVFSKEMDRIQKNLM